VENSRDFRSRFVVGICLPVAAATALLMQNVVLAQQAPTANKPADEKLEEVSVTGIRASLRSSLDVKRDSIQTVDAISAQDIGSFPDKNLSEALQRVTGVQISRQDGEGRSVSVRGAEANLIRVEINGTGALPLSVGAGDRAVDFRDLPVEFVSRIEVVKTPTAEMIEGGISTVRIITRRPFDSTKPYIAASAQGVYSDLAEATDPKLAVFGSHLFFDDTFGALLALQWEKRHLYDAVANTTGWNRFSNTNAGTACAAATARGARSNDFNADGICDWYPQIPRYQDNRRNTERQAASGVLEWRPTATFKTNLDITYARGKEDVDNSLLQLNADGGLFDYANTTIGVDNTPTHIEFTGNGANGSFPLDLSYRNILGSLTRTQSTAVLGAKWDIGQFSLDGRVDYAKAKVHNDEINSTAQVFGISRAIVDYTGSIGAPNISFPAGFDLTSGTGVNRLDSVYNPRDNDTDEKSGGFNVEYRPERLAWAKVKAGVHQHNYKTESRLYQKTVRLSCRTPGADTISAANVVVAQVPCATIEGIVNTNSVTNPLEFFSTGDLGFSNGPKYWNDNTDATIAAALAAAGAVNPLAGSLNPYVTNTNINTLGTFLAYLDNWSVEEKTTGYFAQLQWEFPDLSMPFSGNAGIRYVDTSTNSSGYRRLQTGTTANPVITFVPDSQDGGYTQALPSLNMKLGLLPETLVARLSVGKVMARPSPAQLAIRRSFDIVGLAGSRGNPSLLPFLSTDYDLGLEWYFSQDNYASLALFRKEISRFILNRTGPEVNDVDGQTYSVTRPENGTAKVTVNGVEGGVQYALGFLPAPFNGFGVLANYTYQKDKGFTQPNLIDGTALSFPGLSRNSYNASLYYENEKFSVRASYNWRSHWLINASGRGNLPEFNRAYGQMDATAGYNFTPDISLFLEGINLTNEQLVQENAPARPIQFETFGRRFFFGARAKF
jgi:iron complex outermembrane recepter protein